MYNLFTEYHVYTIFATETHKIGPDNRYNAVQRNLSVSHDLC